ncbi:hypothetical protein NSTC731_04027 [Nostoc sp. DSM 114167]
MAVDLGVDQPPLTFNKLQLANADRVPSRKLLFLDTSYLIDLAFFASAVVEDASLLVHHL